MSSFNRKGKSWYTLNFTISEVINVPLNYQSVFFIKGLFSITIEIRWKIKKSFLVFFIFFIFITWICFTLYIINLLWTIIMSSFVKNQGYHNTLNFTTSKRYFFVTFKIKKCLRPFIWSSEIRYREHKIFACYRFF